MFLPILNLLRLQKKRNVYIYIQQLEQSICCIVSSNTVSGREKRGKKNCFNAVHEVLRFICNLPVFAQFVFYFFKNLNLFFCAQTHVDSHLVAYISIQFFMKTFYFNEFFFYFQGKKRKETRFFTRG